MLRDVYLPEVRNGAGCKNGNWELIMTDAAIGIAVFLDDRAAFDNAVGIWRGRLPGYVYRTTDGSYPKAPSTCPSKDTRAEIVDYWHGQSTFSNGLAQETCRDFGHTGWGLTAATHIAETAYQQGVNLYGEAGKRLTDGVLLPHPPGDRRRDTAGPLRRHREEGPRRHHRNRLQPLPQPPRAAAANNPG